jgi:hypothetical protein
MVSVSQGVALRWLIYPLRGKKTQVEPKANTPKGLCMSAMGNTHRENGDILQFRFRVAPQVLIQLSPR